MINVHMHDITMVYVLKTWHYHEKYP